MSTWAKTLLAVAAVAFTTSAYAADPRCERPPYGGSPDRYRAVQEAYGAKVTNIAKTLEDICKMKFDGADRAVMYKLQFKDEDINRMDTEALALEMFKRTESAVGSK